MTGLKPNSKVYVAPANPAGKALSDELSQEGHEILGLADNFKAGCEIINSADACQEYDYVVVAASSQAEAICKGLVERGFAAKKILYMKTDRRGFISFRRKTLEQIVELTGKAFRNLVIFTAGFFPRKYTVYYSEGFVDSNVLVAWRFHSESYPGECVLAVRRVNLATLSNIPAESSRNLIVNKVRAIWCLSKARNIVVDHEYSSSWFESVRKKRPVIQLWHGLPYKALAGNAHYPGIKDHAFISSSSWFNDNIFRHIFSAHQYLALGYPRCDVFWQAPSDREWASSAGQSELSKLKKLYAGFWIYMPTYRDSGNDDWPIDLSVMSELCMRENKAFLIKAHPFLEEKLRAEFSVAPQKGLSSLKAFPGVYIYSSRLNIYPFLADAELLVTDYSSVAFDFMVTGRPIIYYQWDKSDYEKVRGKCLIGDEEYIKGPAVFDQDSLLAALEKCSKGEVVVSDDSDDFMDMKSPCSKRVVDFVRSLN